MVFPCISHSPPLHNPCHRPMWNNLHFPCNAHNIMTSAYKCVFTSRASYFPLCSQASSPHAGPAWLFQSSTHCTPGKFTSAPLQTIVTFVSIHYKTVAPYYTIVRPSPCIRSTAGSPTALPSVCLRQRVRNFNDQFTDSEVINSLKELFMYIEVVSCK